MPTSTQARRGRLAILVAALAWSTAGIGQRELDVSPMTQVAGRALFAMVGLLALVALTERRGTVAAFRSIGRWGLLSAVLLAISSGAFFLALNYTSVANVLFMQAAAPFFAALLGWWLLGDRILPAHLAGDRAGERRGGGDGDRVGRHRAHGPDAPTGRHRCVRRGDRDHQASA